MSPPQSRFCGTRANRDTAPNQSAEGGQLQRGIAAAENQLQRCQQLEQRQKQQRRHLMHGVAGPRAGAGLNALLLLCQRDERKIYTARSAERAVCFPLTNTPDLECASEIVQLPSS